MGWFFTWRWSHNLHFPANDDTFLFLTRWTSGVIYQHFLTPLGTPETSGETLTKDYVVISTSWITMVSLWKIFSIKKSFWRKFGSHLVQTFQRLSDHGGGGVINGLGNQKYFSSFSFCLWSDGVTEWVMRFSSAPAFTGGGKKWDYLSVLELQPDSQVSQCLPWSPVNQEEI